MKNYTDSDYALNKHSEGIVYRFADGIVEYTLADYLTENPGKTEADFRTLKKLSDANYFEQDRGSYRQTWKDIPIHGLDETEACAAPSLEVVLIDQADQAAVKQRRQDLGLRAFDTLTEVQRRRYVLYHVHGLTIREIADKEGAHFTTVHESLQAAEKKIKKFIMRG